MNVKVPSDKGTATTEYWKNCYERQKFLVNSMKSLLNRYGSSIEREQLYSAFLLTLMGQFVVSDACYYSYSTRDNSMVPAMAYGRLKLADLPPVAIGADQVTRLQKNQLPVPIENLSLNLATASGMKFLSSNFRIFAPLFLKDKLVGVLLLGGKVSGQEYNSADMDVLHSLCSVSATTFNNAILYENAKHSAREIQRLYEVRNEVINRITHEFRTPLTIIKAGVEMLGKDDSYSELVTLFSESETRLEDLINSLLSLSQKGTKEDEGTTTIDALAVLHDAIHRCSTAAREKGIQFEVAQNVGSSRPVLHMDVADFRTILDALLENAIKFSPAKATVSVEVERGSGPPVVERDGLQLPDWKEQTEDLIREYRDMVPHDRAADPTAEKSPSIGQGEFLVVRISDNGIGIPEQDLASVVEPFRQASNSPDLGVKGKGLGLALAHKVVSRHGGRLCCKSVEGRGTTFSVHLPIEGDSGL